MQTPQRSIHVVAGVITDVRGRILLARRGEDSDLAGLWEFPGGKVESGESVRAALARELKEELGIELQSARPLIKVRHDYPDKQVLLDIWKVTRFHGEPFGKEGQECRWVPLAELHNYHFPDANGPIVARLQAVLA